jgi:hypothetical protein
VIVEYDPEMHVWEDALYVGAFIAWAPPLPDIAGVGVSEERALSELANGLYAAVHRHAVPADDLGSRGQLLIAASRFGLDRLVDYLCNLAPPAMLSSDYEVVPR